MTLPQKNFDNTLIIGLGLIGGSFARACRKHKISGKIFAFDLDKESLDLAIAEGIIDGARDLNHDLKDINFIALASPLKTYDKIIKDIKDKVSEDVVIIDLGSIKEFVVKQIPQSLKNNFIPCHPIAGLEKSGFANSTSDLFLDKKFIICHDKSNKNVARVENIAKKIGANVDFLEAKQHDKIYALVSHLPQFLSFLTKEFSPQEISDDFFKTAFRLDNSNPEIWSDIFKFNQNNIEKFYLEFFDNLEKLVKNPELAIEHAPQGDRANKDFDREFFINNFATIFFRALLVVSYLQIKDLKNLQSYAGSGFKDFTSIVKVLNYDKKELSDLIKKNQQKISKLFESISS